MTEKQTFPKSLIEELKILFNASNNQELEKEFVKVTEFLEKHGNISQDTIDDILCSEIQQTIRPENDRFRSGNEYNQTRNSQYNPNYTRRDREFRPQHREFAPRRPGLHELN